MNFFLCVETVAPQEVPLPEGDSCAQARCTGCCHQPGCPCSDHHQVITGRRFGILPVGRMDIGDPSRVVNVMRQNFWNLIHTKAPPQEDPEPAVQAKQCSPVTIRRFIRADGLKDWT